MKKRTSNAATATTGDATTVAIDASSADATTDTPNADAKPNSKSLRRKAFKAKIKLKLQEKKNKVTSTSTTVDEFAGVIAEPGTGTMRSRWKLNDQADKHKTEVNTKKKSARKEREKKELLQEKREVDRTKKKQRSGNEVDNFSFMVDKYKKMLDSNDGGPAVKKVKRSKWYAD